jgi:hypothetical protein
VTGKGFAYLSQHGGIDKKSLFSSHFLVSMSFVDDLKKEIILTYCTRILAEKTP